MEVFYYLNKVLYRKRCSIGVKEIRQFLKLERMTKEELKAYSWHRDNMVILRDNINMECAEELEVSLEKGRIQEKINNARSYKRLGIKLKCNI